MRSLQTRDFLHSFKALEAPLLQAPKPKDRRPNYPKDLQK